MKAKSNTTESIHSPKNRYRAEIRYEKALKEVGSVQSFTGNNLRSLLDLCGRQVRIASTRASVKVIENVDIYPHFNWQQVGIYHMNELGCITSEKA